MWILAADIAAASWFAGQSATIELHASRATAPDATLEARSNYSAHKRAYS